MTVRGIIWNKTKSDVFDALIKHKGVVARAAKELSCSRHSLFLLIRKIIYKNIQNRDIRNEIISNFVSQNDCFN